MKFNDRALCAFTGGLLAGFGSSINLIMVQKNYLNLFMMITMYYKMYNFLFKDFCELKNFFFAPKFKIPAIKASSDPLPSWKRLYKNGSKMGFTLIITTAGLAVKSFMKTEDSRYLLVAGCVSLVIPYTYAIMPTNEALLSMKENKYRETEEDEDKVRKLITKWDKLQYGRTALSLLAFGINVWILTKKVKY